MALSRFFIDRPVFAWVIAIVIMVAEAFRRSFLPIEQYPTIAPPAVAVNAFYPGADAATVQNSVTQVIEQQLTGLDNLLYFSSNSNADGSVSLIATFAPGTDPDIAQVQVQNKVQQAVAQLPTQVQQIGVTVAKAQTNFLLIVVLYDPTNRNDNVDLSNFMVSKMQDPLSRVTGVGNVQGFGAQYAMRIWLDPYKLHDLSLEPADVYAAIQAQNVQVSAGQIGGQPAVPGQTINATVTAQSQLQTPDQFRNIILKTAATARGAFVGRGARELGADTYGVISNMNGHPAAGLAIMPTPGANALKLVDQVKAQALSQLPQLPPGVQMTTRSTIPSSSDSRSATW